MYVGDRLVLSSLSQPQIAEIAAGRVSLDRLIRTFIHDHLTYRFVVLDTGGQGRALETLIRSGALQTGQPLLTPSSPRPRLDRLGGLG